jgi:heterodisulfide reductase subunit A-like polyferredoxin
MTDKQAIVIGTGARGMMAAGQAAEVGAVLLLENSGKDETTGQEAPQADFLPNQCFYLSYKKQGARSLAA